MEVGEVIFSPLLSWAIYEYLKVNDQELKEIPLPGLYEIEPYEVAITNIDNNKIGVEGDHLEIWGIVTVDGKEVWTSKNNGDFNLEVDTDKDYIPYPITGQKITKYTIPDNAGNINDSKKFSLYAKFKEMDGGDADDQLGTKNMDKYLRDIKETQEKLELRFKNENNEGVDLVVRAWTRKIPLKDLGISDPNNITYKVK